MVKKLPADAGNVRDMSLIPESERSPGGGNGNPLQYSFWRISWTEEPRGLQSIGSHRVRHNWSDSAKEKGVRVGQWASLVGALTMSPELVKKWKLSHGWVTHLAPRHKTIKRGCDLRLCVAPTTPSSQWLGKNPER